MTFHRRTIATIAAFNLLAVTNLPPPSRANPAVVAPAACAIPGVGWVGCAVLGTVMVAGSIYLLVQLNSGEQMQLPRENVRTNRAEIRGDDSNNIERHGVVDRQDCYTMAEQFRQAGRNVRLRQIRRTGNPGSVLKYECIFEGDDAQEGWYHDQWNR